MAPNAFSVLAQSALSNRSFVLSASSPTHYLHLLRVAARLGLSWPHFPTAGRGAHSQFVEWNPGPPMMAAVPIVAAAGAAVTQAALGLGGRSSSKRPGDVHGHKVPPAEPQSFAFRAQRAVINAANRAGVAQPILGVINRIRNGMRAETGNSDDQSAGNRRAQEARKQVRMRGGIYSQYARERAAARTASEMGRVPSTQPIAKSQQPTPGRGSPAHVVEQNPGPPKQQRRKRLQGGRTQATVARTERKIADAEANISRSMGRDRRPKITRPGARGPVTRQVQGPMLPSGHFRTTGKARKHQNEVGNRAGRDFQWRRQWISPDGSEAVIGGVDYIGPCTITATTGAGNNINGGVVKQFYLNPSQSVTLSLAQFARMFQRFEFLIVAVHYRGSVGGFYNGSLSCLPDVDPTDNDGGGTGLVSMAATTKGAHEINVRGNTRWVLNAQKEGPGIYYCQDDTSSGAATRQTNQGHFVVFVVNTITDSTGPVTSGTNVGSFYFEYRCRFFHRQINPPSQVTEKAAMITTANSAVNIWGDATTPTTYITSNFGTYIASIRAWSGTGGAVANFTGGMQLHGGTYIIGVRLGAVVTPAVGTTQVNFQLAASAGATIISLTNTPDVACPFGSVAGESLNGVGVTETLQPMSQMTCWACVNVVQQTSNIVSFILSTTGTNCTWAKHATLPNVSIIVIPASFNSYTSPKPRQALLPEKELVAQYSEYVRKREMESLDAQQRQQCMKEFIMAKRDRLEAKGRMNFNNLKDFDDSVGPVGKQYDQWSRRYVRREQEEPDVDDYDTAGMFDSGGPLAQVQFNAARADAKRSASTVSTTTTTSDNGSVNSAVGGASRRSLTPQRASTTTGMSQPGAGGNAARPM